MIERNWPDILRISATGRPEASRPARYCKLAYPRQNELATALREVGRVERTLFMIDWILDADLQRRAQIGAQQGRSASCAEATNFHRRVKSATVPPKASIYRIAGMNLLAAIIIFWNTMKLGEVVANQKRGRENCYCPICWPMSRRWDGSTSISQENIVGQSLSVDSAPPANEPRQGWLQRDLSLSEPKSAWLAYLSTCAPQR